MKFSTIVLAVALTACSDANFASGKKIQESSNDKKTQVTRHDESSRGGEESPNAVGKATESPVTQRSKAIVVDPGDLSTDARRLTSVIGKTDTSIAASNPGAKCIPAESDIVKVGADCSVEGVAPGETLVGVTTPEGETTWLPIAVFTTEAEAESVAQESIAQAAVDAAVSENAPPESGAEASAYAAEPLTVTTLVTATDAAPAPAVSQPPPGDLTISVTNGEAAFEQPESAVTASIDAACGNPKVGDWRPGDPVPKKVTPSWPRHPRMTPDQCRSGFEINDLVNAAFSVDVKAPTVGSQALTLEVDVATYSAPDRVQIYALLVDGSQHLIFDSCRLRTSTKADPSGTQRPPEAMIRDFRPRLPAGTKQLKFGFGKAHTPTYVRILGLCDFDLLAPNFYAGSDRAPLRPVSD